MRVAAVQYKPDRSQPAFARQALAELAAEAAIDSDLVVLPEMAAIGYHFPTRESILPAAEAADGPLFRALSPIAKSAGAYLVAGFAERAGERLYNSALVIDPAGDLRFVYRKTLLYDADIPWATPGDSGYRAFDTPAGRFGVGICMDLNDDNFVEWARTANLRAIAFPTNWLDQDENIWDYWAMRLYGVPGALVAANTYGEDGPLRFRGESAIVDDGWVLDAAPWRGDAIVRARLV